MVEATTSSGPLAGLVVVDLSTTLPGAQASQFLADAGADVILVEPPGGSPLRELSSWPALLRNKRSVVLNLHDESDAYRLRGLLQRADVMITTLRPAAVERLGLTAEVLAQKYPRLISAMVTGWGSRGPWRDYKGWEALIMAKTGVMFEKRQLTSRPGPAYVSVPYASFGAAHAAVHGILAALIDRESTGRGQCVESNLVTGMGALDPYNWFYELVLDRYPGAFEPMNVAYDEQGRPQAYLIYALLIAATKDDRYLQFAQVSPRLIHAWLAELDLLKDLADPKWAGFPMLPTAELRAEFWDMMIERVRARSLQEWQHVFETNLDVAAEIMRTPEEALEHPQLVHDGRVLTVEDPVLGAVRQPSTLVHSDGKPLTAVRRAPRCGEHTEAVLSQMAAPLPDIVPDEPGTATLPLQGVTIIEFGTMFAAPYGATLLGDLGARVIKIEPLAGDNIRTLVAFPEAGGAKVLQGKESVALDITTAEGREIVHELVKHADVVLQCFRGQAAQRAQIDEDSLKAINPNLVYLTAPGYGVDGPFATRGAYAPSIGAASGMTLTDAGGPQPAHTIDDVHRSAVRLHAAGASPAVQSDGVAALGVASALLLGIYAKRRGTDIPHMVTTMLGSAANAMIAFNVTYPNRAKTPAVDAEFWGINALYRMYPAADGFVFLAAPLASEWPALAKALSAYVDLDADVRFGSAQARADHDDALSTVLAGVFATKDKDEWESELTRHDVGCVAVTEDVSTRVLQTDPFFEAGYAVNATSPIFDEHRRLAPLVRLSRSLTKADGGCTIGQHTTVVLGELGLTPQRLAELREKSVIGG
jgi:crotonobetainyl-CoA:carnitine CoA-transferase CaiB-like acyl-CoA transferase